MTVLDKNDISTHIYKLIIAGPVGAGKTEAIRSISDNGVVTTEANASDEVKLIKKTTTVAMDYGVMKLDSGEQIRIYGTPGQKRFDFMWEILSENALGLVLLLNAKEPNPLSDLEYYLEQFMPLIKGSTLVVGITHAEDAPKQLHNQITDYLINKGLIANVMFTDARDRSSVRQLVHSLILMIAS